MRIGISGYNSRTGLGSLNNSLARFLFSQGVLSHWGLYRHRSRHIGDVAEQYIQHDMDVGGPNVDRFLAAIDILVFCEHPLNEQVVRQAKSLGKRVVCIPMQEWLFKKSPNKLSWEHLVDLWIFPTSYGYHRWKSEYENCSYVPWPTEPDIFEFSKREVCRRFLFLNGNGGFRQRKGCDTILQALQLFPELPLTFFSQVPISEFNNGTSKFPNLDFRLQTDSHTSLYSEENGDVLLYPHKVDGLGLEAYEAACCGIPVIATDGPIWDDVPSIKRIASAKRISSTTLHGQAPLENELFIPNPECLVDSCRRILGTDISSYSQEARRFAVENRWEINGPRILAKILGD